MGFSRTMRRIVVLPFLVLVVSSSGQAAQKPNIVLIMTDDQGYGDLACHGNREIKTPHLDKLHAESVRLTNYHVDPTCSPTRSALMTGRYSSRTGVWHTIQGRSLMHPEEVTLAEVFSQAGYATGIFGKWHLGDNFPLRPQDQGFQEVLVHGGGGVTQTPDYWGNDYFGDTYFHNGVPKKFEKYCTDVWFDEAMKFIEKNKDRPFLAYIPTNAPHGPYLVDEKYSQPYEQMGLPAQRAKFYGMITNIDENVGRLDAKLAELGLRENTILIFTTDNGTAAGAQNGGFNAGMRGQKGSEYEGGHRVPFFIRWPGGKITGGRSVSDLTAHIDVLPTLAELCGIQLPQQIQRDGLSLVRLLRLSERTPNDWPMRTLFVHSQRLETPQKWRKAAVMTASARLVMDGDRRELFLILRDPAQIDDVSKDHPDLVCKLTAEYEKWYESISMRFDDYVRITLGDESANPVHLSCHDWHTDDKPVPWNQQAVSKNPKNNGFWAVDVKEAGRYEITLRMRPHYVKDPSPLNTHDIRIRVDYDPPESPLDDNCETQAEIQSRIAGISTLAHCKPSDVSTKVVLKLEKGPARLTTELLQNDERGAYFVDVKWLGK